MTAPAARRTLARVLASLDERSRSVLALACLDGLSASEIADVLHATPQQVTRELALARRALERAAVPARRRRA